MRVDVQFTGYAPFVVDTDDPSSLDIFEQVGPGRAGEILRDAITEDVSPTEWVLREVPETGERFQFRIHA